MKALPPELWRLIARWLDARSALRLSTTCKLLLALQDSLVKEAVGCGRLACALGAPDSLRPLLLLNKKADDHDFDSFKLLELACRRGSLSLAQFAQSGEEENDDGYASDELIKLWSIACHYHKPNRQFDLFEFLDDSVNGGFDFATMVNDETAVENPLAIAACWGKAALVRWMLERFMFSSRVIGEAMIHAAMHKRRRVAGIISSYIRRSGDFGTPYCTHYVVDTINELADFV